MPTKTVAFAEEAAFIKLPAGGELTSNRQNPGRHLMDAFKKSDGRILVLEPDEQLAATIARALSEAVPAAEIDSAQSLEEAQRMAMKGKPDLFVLDVDATYDLGQDFLYDLRTSHPNSRAIILTATHLSNVRERAAGIGAIHFLEKPFPHNDFVDLVQALLRPSVAAQSEKFQGTLSDLHMADIIQLKCMSGTTAAIEFTSPSGEKGRIYFENGQIRHATAPGKEGVDAFNEIVQWKGGRISEVDASAPVKTISQDWQLLLMEGMRKMDEAQKDPETPRSRPTRPGRILVIDDSVMLLSFVEEILTENHYDVRTATNAADSLKEAEANPPDLILLDYILPDMKGDEVTRRLRDNPVTAKIPVVYMSGLSADLRPAPAGDSNVIGSLNKPFTSDLLIKTVETHMPESSDHPEAPAPETQGVSHGQGDFAAPQMTEPTEPTEPQANEPAPQLAPTPAAEEWWSAPPSQETWAPPATTSFASPEPEPVHEELMAVEAVPAFTPAPAVSDAAGLDESLTGGTYFCGDTSFFSLNWALQTIGKDKLTGTLRCFSSQEPIELLVRNGEIMLATSKDPNVYCPEAPITLVNVDHSALEEARANQRETGCPLFLTLAQGGQILQEPALQLVQHYGQKLFANLWTAPRVRFIFSQTDLPTWASGLATEGDIDHWALATLRLVQFPDIARKVSYEPSWIPAYTRDGFDRIQNLRLTVAEAQFASQFNGVRSIQQIAKNLRLDLKFARLTLFRFLALEIVECWPPTATAKTEKKGVFQRLSRSIGMGE
jgi:DNA-binding response OmpR family regulator